MHPDNHTTEEAHHSPILVLAAAFFARLGGLLAALLFYGWRPALPAEVARANQPLYRFLLNRWYFDELYQYLWVNPAMWLGRTLWKRGDGDVIDGTINGVAMGAVPFFTRIAGRAQSGYLFHYAFAMVIGLAVLLAVMTIGS